MYWINFQNIYAFTYQKIFLHTLLLFVYKIVQSLQCILKLASRIWNQGRIQIFRLDWVGEHVQRYTLSKCPGGHPIFQRRLKLNLNISVGKYIKKINSPGLMGFSLRSYTKCMFKKCRDSIKRVATLAKTENARKASHRLIVGLLNSK